MRTFDNPVAEWRHAYQVLGVPHDASAHVIKSTYRALMKRWHPDRYVPNTADHADATRMTALINEAYSSIEYAPLRYRRHEGAYDYRSWEEANPRTTIVQPKSDPPRRVDRIEFWVRFVCGGLLGLLWTIGLLLTEFTSSSVTQRFETLLVLGALGLIVGFGLASARFGDKFWHNMLRASRWYPF